MTKKRVTGVMLTLTEKASIRRKHIAYFKMHGYSRREAREAAQRIIEAEENKRNGK